MKKLFFLVLALMLSLLVACSNSGGEAETSAEGGEQEIVVWTWPNNDQTFEEITIPLFEEEHPDINVTVQAFGVEEYPDKLSSALIAGEGPDVAMVEIGNVINIRELGMFEDLSQAPYNAGEFEDQYLDYSWDYVTGDDGYIFALPKNSAPAAMFYNKPLFEEAGLPTDPAEVHELMKTWDDYVKVAEQITVPGERWMFGTPVEITNAVTQQAGTSYFNEDGELQIDNEHFMYAYEKVKELNEIGAISPYNEYSAEWNTAMQSGNVATYLYGNWFGKYLKNNATGSEGEWGVTYAPEYQGKSAFNQGGDFIGIVGDSEKKEAAWEFVKFVSQNMDNLEEMYKKDELYPAYKEAIEKEWINSENEFFGGQVTNEVFGNVAQEMVAPYITENDPYADKGVRSLLTNITLGDMSIDQALEQAKQEVNARVQ